MPLSITWEYLVDLSSQYTSPTPYLAILYNMGVLDMLIKSILPNMPFLAILYKMGILDMLTKSILPIMPYLGNSV